MKKTLALLLSLVMVLAMAACTTPAPKDEVKQDPAPVVEEPTAEPVVEEPTAEPVVEEPTAEPAVEEPTAEPAAEDALEVDVAELFAAVGMVEAESYDFVCADGYAQNVIAADIPQCKIIHVEDRIDASVPGIGNYTLYNIYYIIPSGLTKEAIDPAAGVQRIVVFEGAVIADELEESQQTRGSDKLYDKCYSFAQLAEKSLWATPAEEITLVAIDGYESEQLLMDLNEKYITLGHKRMPTFAGEKADKNIEPWYMAYMLLGNEAVAFARYELPAD